MLVNQSLGRRSSKLSSERQSIDRLSNSGKQSENPFSMASAEEDVDMVNQTPDRETENDRGEQISVGGRPTVAPEAVIPEEPEQEWVVEPELWSQRVNVDAYRRVWTFARALRARNFSRNRETKTYAPNRINKATVSADTFYAITGYLNSPFSLSLKEFTPCPGVTKNEECIRTGITRSSPKKYQNDRYNYMKCLFRFVDLAAEVEVLYPKVLAIYNLQIENFQDEERGVIDLELVDEDDDLEFVKMEKVKARKVYLPLRARLTAIWHNLGETLVKMWTYYNTHGPKLIRDGFPEPPLVRRGPFRLRLNESMVWTLGNMVAAGEIHQPEIVISRIRRITNIVYDEDDDNASNGGENNNNTDNADSGPSTADGLPVAEGQDDDNAPNRGENNNTNNADLGPLTDDDGLPVAEDNESANGGGNDINENADSGQSPGDGLPVAEDNESANGGGNDINENADSGQSPGDGLPVAEDNESSNGGGNDINENADSGRSPGDGLPVEEDNESSNGQNSKGAGNKSPEIEDDEDEEVAEREPSPDVDTQNVNINENGLYDNVDRFCPCQERNGAAIEEDITDRRPNAEREPSPDIDPRLDGSQNGSPFGQETNGDWPPKTAKRAELMSSSSDTDSDDYDYLRRLNKFHTKEPNPVEANGLQGEEPIPEPQFSQSQASQQSVVFLGVFPPGSNSQ